MVVECEGCDSKLSSEEVKEEYDHNGNLSKVKCPNCSRLLVDYDNPSVDDDFDIKDDKGNSPGKGMILVAFLLVIILHIIILLIFSAVRYFAGFHVALSSVFLIILALIGLVYLIVR